WDAGDSERMQAAIAAAHKDGDTLGGVRHGLTQGSPIAVRIANSEWPKWELVMAADPLTAEQASSIAEAGRNAPLTRPRPGHADLAGMQKYGFDDARPVLERASARETAMRVALGAVARAFLQQALGVEVFSHVVRIGEAQAEAPDLPKPSDQMRIDSDPVRCWDAGDSERMQAAIAAAHKDGDTVHADRKIDARLAAAVMSIQAVKGVEIGDGFASAARRGSQAHDEIVRVDGQITRLTDRAGGTEGGMTNGSVLRVRAAMKPISTVPRALRTIDTATGDDAVAHAQRSDTCAVPALGVIAEAAVAMVLADAALEKFGGDSLAETRRNLLGYLENLEIR
ncbi:MAG: chorismate synthase, partial [Actinobacteria bacterium]|nr:chorismate synthase [Actinomycetota bacterium]